MHSSVPRRWTAVVLALCLLAAAGCGASAADGVPPAPPSAPGVTQATDSETTALPLPDANLVSAAVSVEEGADMPPPEDVRVHLSAIGDIMAHDGTIAVGKRTNGYDYSAMLEEVAPYIKGADYAFGNLETTFSGAGRGYSGYPTFNTPEQLASDLKNVLGLDMVSTANNHTLDKGLSGLVSTLDFLDAAGLAHTGSFRTKEERAKPFIAQIQGTQIAFVSYTYGSNTPLSAKNAYALNIIDKEALRADAAAARAQGADYVIALLHWGLEYKRTQSKDQSALAKWLFENTEIDLIVGNHAHVVQPMEQIEVEYQGRRKVGTVLYALGNFTGAQRWEYTDTGILVDLHLVINPADASKNRIESITYMPLFIDPNPMGHKKRYRVVAMADAIKGYENGTDTLISKDEYDKLVRYQKGYAEQLQTVPIVTARTAD